MKTPDTRPSPLEFVYFGGGVVRCRDVSWVRARPIETRAPGVWDGVMLELVMTTGKSFCEQLSLDYELAVRSVCQLFDKLRATTDHRELAEQLLRGLKIYEAEVG